MYQPLAPCPACSRHVKTTEERCPFCAGALPQSFAGAATPAASGRLTRAAAFAFTATLAVTGCSTGTTPNPVKDAATTGPDDAGSPIAEYGASPIDAGPDDSGGTGAKYGAPPIDSGS